MEQFEKAKVEVVNFLGEQPPKALDLKKSDKKQDVKEKREHLRSLEEHMKAQHAETIEMQQK